MMLSVDDALKLVLGQVRPIPPRGVPLGEALGCVLAEAAAADADSPPHDKSVVDGYAIRCDDLTDGRAELRVVEEVTAGQVPQHAVEPGGATRIMTGAPLPAGADAVVMVERTVQPTPNVVRIDDPRLKRGANIVRRGTSMRRGETVLEPNAAELLRPAQIGLLAEVGRATVRVVPRPHVAVLATGNELVSAEQTPGPGQIRNSNGPMLAALIARAGGVAHDSGIARDDREELRRKIRDGLTFDALILSGGVSAGVADFVPGVLAESGVVEVFHKVNLKPGKPIWFGVHRTADGAVKPVFGLPGNPVSTFVCFELFVQPAIDFLRGLTGYVRPVMHRRCITETFTHRGDRPTYWPATTYAPEVISKHASVTPCKWHGSGDLRGIAQSDCFICFPPGDKQYAVGDEVPVLMHTSHFGH